MEPVELQTLEWDGQRVVTFEQIADVHHISVKNVHRAYREHSTRFEEGKHFYRLDFKESALLLRIEEPPSTLLVFTEKGYLLLVKPMRDDTSWLVQERMVDDYFRLRSQGMGGAIVPTFNRDQLATISQAAAVVMQQYTPPMIDARVQPLEKALEDLTQRQDEIEHHVTERLSAIEGRQVVAPMGWKTAYAFIRELVGPERERFRYMTVYKSPQGAHDMGYFEYFCVLVTRERAESPQQYLAGERMRLHFPPDILEAAFVRFKHEVEAGRLGGQRRLHLAGFPPSGGVR